ncbi:MAG: metallophosphoesterase [Roseburia sp.]|nr:metallophosphoesterase [Roseburia sp.]
MATYVISDIHGEYDRFIELLAKINLKESDTLYILGDVLDRGPHPIKALMKLMEMPNAVCIAGNHELMALECLEFLRKEITNISLEELDENLLNNLVTWQYNGSKTTIDEFRELDKDMQQAVIDYITDLLLYEELTIGENKYLLVHAGLDNFAPEKKPEEYSPHELVWKHADCEKKYFDDVYVVIGHTPTQVIAGNPKPGFIYRKNNNIAIDCGACFKGGRLAALCLDTGEEFYSSTH